MMDPRDRGTTNGTGAPQATPAAAGSVGFNKKSIEKRLEEAHAKRALALQAKKNPSAAKPAAPEPPAPREPVAQPPTPVASDDVDRFVLDADFEVVEEKDTAPVPAVPSTALVASLSTANADQAPRRALSVPAVALIAFASCFGLSAGVVLSYSAAVGMSWLRFGETSVPAPDLQPAGAEGFQSGLIPRADSAPLVSTLQPVEPLRSSPVALSEPSWPDISVAPIKSPGPRLADASITHQIVSRNDVDPLSFASAFTAPVGVPVQPDTLTANSDAQDMLPFLPEKNSVHAMLFVDNMPVPNASHLNLTSLSEGDAVPSLLDKPELFKSARGDSPRVAITVPRKLSVPSYVVEQLTAVDIGSAEVNVTLPDTTAPVEKSTYAALPAAVDTGFALPSVGPTHELQLSLAEKLERDMAGLDAVRLFTYAPGNLGAGDMQTYESFLQSTGYAGSTITRVNYRVSSSHIRFYTDSDAAAAIAIAEALGVEARDFTTSQYQPPQGRIEVYLQGGRPQVTAPATVTRQAPAPQRLTNQRTRLEDTILNRLRRGEQFGTGQQ